MKKSILSSYIIAIILLLVTSCKSVYKYNYSSLDTKIKEQKINPLKLDFSGFVTANNKKHKIGGKIKIDEYSTMYIQIKSSALGIEICRLQLFNDSLIFINRLEKKAYKGLIKNSMIKYDIANRDLIDLLIGNIVKMGGNNYQTKQIGNSIKLIYADKTISQDIEIDKKNAIISQNISQNGNKIAFNYHRKLKRNELPQALSFEISNTKQNVSGTLNYNNIKKLKNKIENITVPKNYTTY